MIREAVDNNEMELFYTLDEALDMVGFGKFQALVLAYAGLGAMAEAMEVMILSFIGPSVKDEWGLSSGQESLITTMVFAGMLVGAYLIGLLSVAVVTSIFAFLSAFSPNYISLVVFRMVAGIGLGGGPVYTSWYLEFVPVRNRGFWMVIFSTFWSVGSMLEGSLAWIVIPRLGWRWLLALSSVPCLAAFVFYFLTVESPRYLYLNEKIADAHNVLKKMAAINKSELPSGMLVSHQVSELDEELTPSEDAQLLSIRKWKVNIPKSVSPLFTLLSSSLIKTTLLLWVVYFGNSFVYYGVVLMTSELSSGQSKCGAIVLHSSKTDSSLYRNVFITSLAEFPGLILSAVLVDKIGRRISMVLMYSCGFIFLLPLMFHLNELTTTCLLFGARMCIIGNYTIAGIYCPELYPTSVRTTGVGVATAVGRVAGMICPLVAVGLISGCHRMAAISLYEVVLLLAGISVLLLPIETKGRKLVDIVACGENYFRFAASSKPSFEDSSRSPNSPRGSPYFRFDKKRPPPAPKSDAHAGSGSGSALPSTPHHLADPSEALVDADPQQAARTTPARSTPQRPLTFSEGQPTEKASASRGKSHKEKAPKSHKSRSWDSGNKDREEPSSKRLRLGSSLESSGKQPATEANEETCSNPEMEAQVN
ncbi:hypothetical protein DH2020_034525 [Rehmannia glutinosa]|uniref:Major facilitator superfamily (MFS) profile domain-containing protein n=1 Tax=Rehmannia glutinosa TaxID=99300 RepID=A0ABR0V9T1_REHGL